MLSDNASYVILFSVLFVVMGAVVIVGTVCMAYRYGPTEYKLTIDSPDLVNASENMPEMPEVCSYYMTLDNLTACQQYCEVLK